MNPLKQTQQQRREISANGKAQEWIGGLFKPPVNRRKGDPFQFELILFLEWPNDLVVGMEVNTPMAPVPFAEALARTMTQPLVGPPRRPRLLRVADPLLAAELQTVFTELVIEVGPTPELDGVFEHLIESMAAKDRAASYFEEPKPSRNAACWCGSGQKYKKCCLAKDEESARSQSANLDHPSGSHLPNGVASAHRIEEPLIPKLVAFARSQFDNIYARASADFIDVASSSQLFVPWLLYCVKVEGTGIAEHYLEQHGDILSSKERALLAAQSQSWLSVWEVTAVKPGLSIKLQDLLSGEERLVHELSASKAVNVRDAILGRVVDFDGESVLGGVHQIPLPPMDAAEVVRRIRAKLRRKTAVPLDRLRSESLGRFLIQAWEESAAELVLRSQIRPALHNTDGDKLLLTCDHFAFDPTKQSQIDRCLRAIPNLDPPDTQDQPFTFLRPSKPKHSNLDTIVVGTAMLGRGKLMLETNSIERADALRKLVEESCQGLLQHRLRELTDPSGPVSDGELGTARLVPQSEPPPAEVDAVIRQYKADYYARWVDEPLPALSGKTPRQAIRTKAGREQVEVLLKGIENLESRQPGGPQVSLTSIRTELGLL
jgi:hypothetical protein